MTKNLRKIKQVPPRPKVAHRKRMTERVHGATYTANPELFAHELEITKDVRLQKISALLRAKDEVMLVAGKVPIQGLAKLNAHWYESLLITLSVDQKRQRLKVHILAREAQQLVNPKAGIKRGKDEGLEPRFITPDGLPVYEPMDLLRAKR
jgi:hypothetical protein